MNPLTTNEPLIILNTHHLEHEIFLNTNNSNNTNIFKHTDLTDLTDLPMLRMAHGYLF